MSDTMEDVTQENDKELLHNYVFASIALHNCKSKEDKDEWQKIVFIYEEELMERMIR
jgi:hypothetical protein